MLTDLASLFHRISLCRRKQNTSGDIRQNQQEKRIEKAIRTRIEKKKRIDGSQTAAEFEVCFRVGMIHVPTNAALNSLTQLKSP